MKQPLINLTDIPETGSAIVDFFGREVHVFKQDGKPRAVANSCLHFGGPLDFDGETCQFTCQWHQAVFDAKTGKPVSGPAPSASRLMYLSTIEEDGQLQYIWGE